MKTSEFDKKFDDNEEDIMEYIDLSSATRPNLDIQRVNVDFPKWMVHKLDQEAAKRGVSRQSVIKHWLADRLERG